MEPRKVSVLIADDERHIRTLVSALVTAMGATVVAEAADGEMAVQLFEQHRPALVLLDMNMPVIDGLGALKRIRQIDAQAVVVMLTSVSAASVVEACLDAGAWSYILKDTSAQELGGEIARAWREFLAMGTGRGG